MSSGQLPPVPDLIPISSLRRSSSCGESSPALPQEKLSTPERVMGEQRSRRTGSKPPVELIDSAGSRGTSAAPQAPQSRKVRSERHRKSDRRREHRKPARTRSESKHSTTSPERPAVNPIFVWIRQEDTRIVDVKCEDYDKRNRILLTKTAQGWRAIPRTETLVPSLKEEASRNHHHHHHHHRPRKSRKNKIRRKSAAVQVDCSDEDAVTWDTPVNVESLLPSHTITKNVNNCEDDAQTPLTAQCSEVSDVSPLENLLAVAELEFNNQLETEWKDQELQPPPQPKGEECDYNEDDDNNLAMDDILTQLEQSLRSPESTDHDKHPPPPPPVPEFPESKSPPIVSTSQSEPHDLSILNQDEEPTDLTIPKSNPRPPSQNSEAIQSPQPSGIPAIPPSPDIVTTTTPNKKVLLESLLASNNQKIALNSEVTIIRQKEPLDLGKNRKSASPTVTCSEEAASEPPAKKFKPEEKPEEKDKIEDKEKPETPRLLELLKNDSEPEPLAQLRQLLTDSVLNVPDPMLVPKEKLSSIISHPGKEIPKLLKQRPELRLPEALAFPHLLQDPDILVITLQQLETIILKQGSALVPESKEEKQVEKAKTPEKPESKETNQANEKEKQKKPEAKPEGQAKTNMTELASDIDAAATAAFNQMMWLPYLNQMEAMSFANNPEMLNMLGAMPMYQNQVPDLSHLFMNNNRFPPPMNFPVQPPLNYNNPLEMQMWQEALMQANMLRHKTPLDFNQKHSFREYLEKMNKAKPVPKVHPPKPKPFPFQNQYFGMPNTNVQMNQFGGMFQHQKGLMGQGYPPHVQKNLHQQPQQQKNRFDPKSNFASYYSQLAQEKMQQHQQQQQQHKESHRNKARGLTGADYRKMMEHQLHQQQQKEKSELSRQQTGLQPIDLSGSTTPGNKLKVKQHLIDPVNAPKLLKHHDDVPEVGSTTASIEEMQDAHKHLWHPLFGNQKGYNSPWNWTTVTATGE